MVKSDEILLRVFNLEIDKAKDLIKAAKVTKGEAQHEALPSDLFFVSVNFRAFKDVVSTKSLEELQAPRALTKALREYVE